MFRGVNRTEFNVSVARLSTCGFTKAEMWPVIALAYKCELVTPKSTHTMLKTFHVDFFQ